MMIGKVVNNTGLAKDTSVYDVDTADELVGKLGVRAVHVNAVGNDQQVEILLVLEQMEVDVTGKVKVLLKAPSGEYLPVKRIEWWNGQAVNHPQP